MDQAINKHLPPKTIRSAFGFFGNSKYSAFAQACSEKLSAAIDSETRIVSLNVERQWKDYGGNRHVGFTGQVQRRDEEGSIGGEIVWLKKLRLFRGNFWSNLNPKSDAELFSDAKCLFRMGKYSEYLALSGHLEGTYSENHVFQRMKAIAQKRL